MYEAPSTKHGLIWLIFELHILNIFNLTKNLLLIDKRKEFFT